MSRTYRILLVMSAAVVAASGCASLSKRIVEIQPPPRPAELDVYEKFVGTWDWEAEMVGAEDPGTKHWSGTAEWSWSLEKRFLHGSMSSRSERLSFDATGLWSWHPTKKKHYWWMFNNWGYPQEGTANYNPERQRWAMSYTSVGLDGTRSYGRYLLEHVSADRIDWRMIEWADPFRLVKKMEMIGSYKRKP